MRAPVRVFASLRPSDRWSLVVALAFGPVGPRERGRRESSLGSHVPGSRRSSVAWSSGSAQRPLRRPCPSCCTEAERDFLSFLALEPSRGLGCGYVGLIASSWLTLTKSAHRRGGGAAAGPRRTRKGPRSLVGGRTGVGVCAGLGVGGRGAQIGSCGFAECWRPRVDCVSGSRLFWAC